MNRQTRTIVVIGLFGVASVVVLSLMARRYVELLDTGSTPRTTRPQPVQHSADPLVQRAAAQVDAFLRIRGKLRAHLDALAPARDVEVVRSELLELRGEALAASGLALEEYRVILEAYRLARAGRIDASTPVGAALARRRVQLRGVDLGDYESPDL